MTPTAIKKAVPKRLQVFVSSTYLDLIEERQAAVQAILEAKHIPAGMELFTAGDQSQWEVIKQWIDNSDVYLLILGGRYGSIDKETGKSYTHLEYEYALEKSIPVFSCVLRDPDKRAMEKGDINKYLERENPAQYKEFKNLVTSKMVRFWENSEEIKTSIILTLNDFEKRNNLIGWVRSNQQIGTRTRFPITQEIQTQRDIITEFCQKVAGAWWQIFRGDSPHKESICYFTIKPEEITNTVYMNGQSFDSSGEEIGWWKSIATRIRVPEREILFLWEGKNPNIKIGAQFHGSGKMEFSDESDSKFQRGNGSYTDICPSEQEIIYYKAINLHRIKEQDESNTMEKGTKEERLQIIKRITAQYQ